jgi:sulfotransferase family protein
MSPSKEMHVFSSKYGDPCGVVLKGGDFRQTMINRIRHLSGVIGRKGGEVVSKDIYDRMMNAVEKLRMIDYTSAYVDYFKERVSGEKVFGEITPAYAMLPAKGFHEIVTLHDQVKFIFILRDPIARAWSHLHMELNSLGVELTYDEKIRRIFLENNKYYCRSDYVKTIINLESVVSTDNILYLFYEDLFSVHSVKKICSFLDIDYSRANFSTKIREGDYHVMPNISEIPDENIYSNVYRVCKERFGDEIPATWAVSNF